MKKETKIRTFETDLSVRQLRNKLNGKSNIFINIVLYLFAGCYAAMSVFVMFYSAVLGVIMLHLFQRQGTEAFYPRNSAMRFSESISISSATG